jgi:hypothetical protein
MAFPATTALLHRCIALISAYERPDRPGADVVFLYLMARSYCSLVCGFMTFALAAFIYSSIVFSIGAFEFHAFEDGFESGWHRVAKDVA